MREETVELTRTATHGPYRPKALARTPRKRNSSPVILLNIAFDAVVSGRSTAWLIAAATYGLGIIAIAASSRLARRRTSPELA